MPSPEAPLFWASSSSFLSVEPGGVSFARGSATGRPVGMEQLEVPSQLPVRLEAGHELLLLTVAVREPIAAEREAGKPALASRILIKLALIWAERDSNRSAEAPVSDSGAF